MIRLQVGFHSLPHSLEKLLEPLSILLAVEERTLDSCHPHLGAHCLEIFAIAAEADGDVLIFLTVARNQLRTSERREL